MPQSARAGGLAQRVRGSGLGHRPVETGVTVDTCYGLVQHSELLGYNGHTPGRTVSCSRDFLIRPIFDNAEASSMSQSTYSHSKVGSPLPMLITHGGNKVIVFSHTAHRAVRGGVRLGRGRRPAGRRQDGTAPWRRWRCGASRDRPATRKSRCGPRREAGSRGRRCLCRRGWRPCHRRAEISTSSTSRPWISSTHRPV